MDSSFYRSWLRDTATRQPITWNQLLTTTNRSFTTVKMKPSWATLHNIVLSLFSHDFSNKPGVACRWILHEGHSSSPETRDGWLLPHVWKGNQKEISFIWRAFIWFVTVMRNRLETKESYSSCNRQWAWKQLTFTLELVHESDVKFLWRRNTHDVTVDPWSREVS